MKRILLSLVLVLIFFGGNPLAADTTPAEKAIAKALDSPINLELDENTTFDELIQMIRDQNPGINIVLFAKDIGIDSISVVTNEPVSYQGLKLRNALRLLLSEQDMTYVIRNEILVLTSQDFAKACARRKINHHIILTSDLTVEPEPEKAEPRKYRTKKRCRLFRR